jgi:dephospho-CoA kinase
VDEFGADVLDSEGRLDRKKVGDLVFADEKARAKLNGILHPRIAAAGAELIASYENHEAPYVLYEAALLVETGAHEAFPVLVVVSAEESVQRLRLIARDGFSVEEANARIESQLPLSNKTAVADFVITNNGNLDETRRQVAEVHEKLSARFSREADS